MKGTEGVDYVITECSHCKGSGKCKCYDCLYAAAVNIVPKNSDNPFFVLSTKSELQSDLERKRDMKIEYFKKQDFEMKCTVCEGVGKVVFWRE